jgi:hypothetical protein
VLRSAHPFALPDLQLQLNSLIMYKENLQKSQLISASISAFWWFGKAALLYSGGTVNLNVS